MWSFHSGITQIQSNLYLCTQLVENGCTHCKKYLNQDMDFHILTCEVVWLVNDLPKKIGKICQALRLKCKVSSFHLHVKFTCFKFLTQIFGFLYSKHQITTREELSPQYSQRVGSYRQIQSWWTDSLKSPCSSICSTLYFNICVLRYLLCVLWVIRIKNLSTLSEVRI